MRVNGTVIHLGFEVGTGAGVAIPLRNMAVAGQTQESGKTTTMASMIARANLRAVTFITKRGEGSFQDARRIAPYFREQTDWQFVASILEASRGEKLRVERAFVIRASKGARTLADVQANVRKALADPKIKGFAADMYLCLDAYLDVVVPQIAAVKWAPSLDLKPGVNAVDLGDMPLEMQHLVIRSAINWVLERERDTVVVIPEAWKFIPQGRGTPVKLAAEAYIRQGSALHNFLWLDSQDLGGIEKAILRSVPVWLLGVQREANEIKRTLDNIPAGTQKPKAAGIAGLKLGEFFACWGDRTVKTYVQPSWMGADAARLVALRHYGHTPRPTAADAVGQIPLVPQEEEPEMCEQHRQIAQQLEETKALWRQEIDRGTKLAERVTTAESSLAAAEAAAKRAQDRVEAADDLGRALARLLPGGTTGGGEPVDMIRLSDAILERVLARIPAGGGGVITVTPPEKLRKDFQLEAVGRILGTVNDLPPMAKKLLKLLIALDKRVSQREAVGKLGMTMGGTSNGYFKALASAGLIDSDTNGTRAAVLDKITSDLADYKPKPEEIEAVYQNVLSALATAGSVAA